MIEGAQKHPSIKPALAAPKGTFGPVWMFSTGFKDHSPKLQQLSVLRAAATNRTGLVLVKLGQLRLPTGTWTGVEDGGRAMPAVKWDTESECFMAIAKMLPVHERSRIYYYNYEV